MSRELDVEDDVVMSNSVKTVEVAGEFAAEEVVVDENGESIRNEILSYFEYHFNCRFVDAVNVTDKAKRGRKAKDTKGWFLLLFRIYQILISLYQFTVTKAPKQKVNEISKPIVEQAAEPNAVGVRTRRSTTKVQTQQSVETPKSQAKQVDNSKAQAKQVVESPKSQVKQVVESPKPQMKQIVENSKVQTNQLDEPSTVQESQNLLEEGQVVNEEEALTELEE